MIKPGEEWGRPTSAARRPRGRGRRRRPRRRGRPARPGRARPVPARRVVRPRRRGRPRPRPIGRASGVELPLDLLRIDDGRGRGQHDRDRHAARRARGDSPDDSARTCASTGRPVFHGPCTTVVDRDRAVPPRPRPRPARPSRRRPGRGAGLRRPGARTARAPGPSGHRHPRPAPEHHPAHRRPGHGQHRPPGRRSRSTAARAPAADLVDVDGRPERLPPPPLTCQQLRNSSRRPDPRTCEVGVRRCAPVERTVATIASPMLYAPETFTDSEADRLRPYFTNLDGPVFALTNLPEVVKGALFAALLALRQEPAPPVPRRVRRRPRPHGRPHRRRDRRPEARRGPLRARLPRVRRRLGRAARRRAPRVRAGVEPAHEDPRVGPADGLPRAVDPLHPVRLAAAGALPLPAPVAGVRLADGHPLRRRPRRDSSTRTARRCPR